MEEQDLRLIEELAPRNEELARLWDEHLGIEKTLAELDKRLYLSGEEQVERKRLQKQKLAGRDRIETILADFRGAAGT
jgi:uncharacterized protein YdcH (DUF465 family)